jgi:membrane-bound ClpP family serine protease
MEKVRVAAQAGGMMGAGGAVAYAGLILVLVALAFLLATWMEFWIAAGIVGLVALVIGVVLLLAGRNRLKETQLAPEKTIDSVKDIVNDMKETVR